MIAAGCCEVVSARQKAHLRRIHSNLERNIRLQFHVEAVHVLGLTKNRRDTNDNNEIYNTSCRGYLLLFETGSCYDQKMYLIMHDSATISNMQHHATSNAFL